MSAAASVRPFRDARMSDPIARGLTTQEVDLIKAERDTAVGKAVAEVEEKNAATLRRVEHDARNSALAATMQAVDARLLTMQAGFDARTPVIAQVPPLKESVQHLVERESRITVTMTELNQHVHGLQTTLAAALERARQNGDIALQLQSSFAAQEIKLDKVIHETTINGGTKTLATEVVKMRDNVSRVRDELYTLDSRLRMETAMRRIADDDATWEGHFGADGVMTPVKVSEQWTAITGMTKDDTQDGGFQRCIAPEDLVRVRSEFDYCRAHEQIIDVLYTCVHLTTKKPTPIRHIAWPVWDRHGKMIGWAGRIAPEPPPN